MPNNSCVLGLLPVCEANWFDPNESSESVAFTSLLALTTHLFNG